MLEMLEMLEMREILEDSWPLLICLFETD